MFLLQLLIVLLALYVGSRYGSLALGAISGIGLAIMVFCFGMKPGTPPTDVIYIIVAAVTCAGMLQASGGMDWLIQIAERLFTQASGQNHILCSSLHILPHCSGRNRTRCLYPHADHLRHCIKKRNTPGASLRCGIDRVTGRNHLLPYSRRRSWHSRPFLQPTASMSLSLRSLW